MAGRRWAESKKPGAEGASATPRPSERSSAGQAAPGAGKNAKTATTKKAQPSPEVMARARARLKPPPAPWHPLPLSELAIVLGSVAMVASVFIKSDGGLVAGFLLIVLGTAEFSWREHHHGYRSHGALLAGLVGLPVALALWKLAGLAQHIALAAGAVVFFVLWSALTASFKSARERRDQQR